MLCVSPGKIQGQTHKIPRATARAGRSLVEVALAAGISPETLRKIEAGRLPAPAFGTVVCLSQALDIPLSDLADVWRADMPIRQAS
ncbi:helix-turn-helix transcriptional regulator [Micromonospora purpureochromogenes]|uniref:helix-turn-helix domain-containing protein n=1 Tax=Micromonospora purpureochromogenes TaxID=47872 RepID=UPI0033CEC442